MVELQHHNHCNYTIQNYILKYKSTLTHTENIMRSDSLNEKNLQQRFLHSFHTFTYVFSKPELNQIVLSADEMIC